MNNTITNRVLIKTLLTAQRNEITEFHVYSQLSKVVKHKENRKRLMIIAAEELGHYELIKKYTQTDVKPGWFKILFFYWTGLILGITFSLKLMEKIEGKAESIYFKIAQSLPEFESIALEEDKHENEIIDLLREEKLDYIGSIVLGLNDALIELVGTLAGLTFALQKPRLIGLIGLITGIAAAFSMAASEYLSNKADGKGGQALKSAFYTGITYIVTVFLLVAPYLLFTNFITALAITLVTAIVIILLFNYYISVVKDYPFKQRFIEMVTISLGVAGLSFLIGFIVRTFFKIDI